MGPAGQHVGPLPGGQTQTAVGRPSRPENRTAMEGEEFDRQLFQVGRDVNHSMAEAMAFVDASLSLRRVVL